MAVYSYLENRSRGIRKYGQTDKIFQSFYSRIRWHRNAIPDHGPGGIYNLEFSPNGSVLVAACEKKNIQLYDTNTCQKYSDIPQAHSDCVNCVKFIDDRLFATCSDDCSVGIWDLRNLKSRIRHLTGHKSWVKNIEYSRRDNLLVTSGLDGSIYTWDIKKVTDESPPQKVFHTPGLMRCRISNDETKMVICTTGGYLIIVNDLNLGTLQADLKGFRPNIHRMMQLGEQYYPIVSEFNHVFDSRRRRNRIELISDFPEKNDAEVVCSLAIHPHNWVALSRNMNADENSEWTCVHDIQEMTDPYQHQKRYKFMEAASSSGGGGGSSSAPSAFGEQEDEYDAVKKRVGEEFAKLRQQVLDHLAGATTERGVEKAKEYLEKVNRFLTLLSCPGAVEGSAGAKLPVVASTSFDMWVGQMTDNRLNSSRIGPMRSGLISARVVEDPEHPELTAANGIYLSTSEEEEEEDDDDDDDDQEGDEEEEMADAAAENDILLQRHVENVAAENAAAARASPTTARSSQHRDESSSLASVSRRLAELIEELRSIQRHMNNKYKTNKPRLLYYIQESNAGKGFIKELCFSSDGRVIASPQGNGVRILSFNATCQELCDCVESWHEPQKPRPLTELVADPDCHPNIVLCTKFSPNYPLLVSGCLQGNIVWHTPQL